MPKIIENARQALLDEARRQVEKNGYQRVTVRSVASACGMGVGTVYNYFPSKDMLIASFMADDWRICLDKISKKAEASPSCQTVIEAIYDEITDFSDIHRALFSDPAAMKVFTTTFNHRHAMFRGQIAALIRPFCENAEVEDKDFLADFAAESLITWTVAGRKKSDVTAILNLLLKN